jgi:C4-dicarboxylate transporter DctM subunit
MLFLLVSIFILLFLNVPVAISLGLSILLFLMFSFDLVTISWLVQGMFTSLDSFPLMAVPFFIFAGTIMEQGGLSEKLIKFASSLVGGIKSGLAIVLIISCFFFGAISGSGPATVAAIGGIMIPSMVNAGYSRKFSSALAASAGSLGVIVPPSIPMVVFCIATGVSVGDLFIAGFIPGIIVATALSIAAYFVLKNNTEIQYEKKKVSFVEIFKAAKEAVLALLVPFIILGGIYGGIFTPTEAAVVAVVYSLFVSFFIYKSLTVKQLIRALIDSSTMVGTILLLAAFATPLGRLITMLNVPAIVVEFLTNISKSPVVILFLINIFLLIVGMFLDTLSSILILAPIILPIVKAIGVDPIHFGIIMVINLAIGFITPPVGVNLLVGSSVGKVTFEEIIIENTPFLIALLIALTIITFVPSLSTILPYAFK